METYLLYGLIALDAVLIAVVVFLILKYRNLDRAYNKFMKGRDGENLEDIIMDIEDDVRNLESEDEQNKEAIRLLNKMHRASFQKYGIIHYNAFKGMGGNLSFACALLDYTNTGFVLNSVHSREGCYVYIKVVDCGKTDILLGTEEQQALELALGYMEREQ